MMVKELPQKWKEHIRKMVQYSEKSLAMRTELEDYLIKLGFTTEETHTQGKCIFEDAIIDTMQHDFNWESLIDSIELEMNKGNDGIEIGQVYPRCKNYKCGKSFEPSRGIKNPLNGKIEFCSEKCLQEELTLYAKVLNVDE